MTTRILHDFFRHIALLQGRQASPPARIRQGGLQATLTQGNDGVLLVRGQSYRKVAQFRGSLQRTGMATRRYVAPAIGAIPPPRPLSAMFIGQALFRSGNNSLQLIKACLSPLIG